MFDIDFQRHVRHQLACVYSYLYEILVSVVSTWLIDSNGNGEDVRSKWGRRSRHRQSNMCFLDRTRLLQKGRGYSYYVHYKRGQRLSLVNVIMSPYGYEWKL